MIFVEVIDRRGRVLSRSRVETLPFRIGRAYDADLILDDPHVSPLHAVVERDAEGRLRLRDADSRNGIALEGGRERLPAVTLDGDVSVRLGRTLVRLRAPDFPVPDAVPIVRRSALSEWLREHWSAAVVIPLLVLGLDVFGEYRSTTSEFEPLDALSAAAWSLLIFAGWIGAWALLNRLLRQRTRFVAHSTVAFGASAAYTLTEWGFEWLRFLFAPVEPLQLANQFAWTALFGLLLLGHLTVMGVARRPVRFGIVGLGFAALLGLQLIDHYGEDTNWVTTLPYWSRLEPLDPTWLPVESADAFFAGIPELAEQLDALAEEAREEDEDGEPEHAAGSG